MVCVRRSIWEADRVRAGVQQIAVVTRKAEIRDLAIIGEALHQPKMHPQQVQIQNRHSPTLRLSLAPRLLRSLSDWGQS
jgi:hypothetical protein